MFGNTTAIVLHTDMRHFIHFFSRDPDMTLGMAHGIGNQIGKRAFEMRLICPDHQVFTVDIHRNISAQFCYHIGQFSHLYTNINLCAM